MMRMNIPVICMVAFFFAGGVAMANQTNSPNSGSWSGVIMNNNCTADEAFAEAPKCTEKDVPGAKLILYDDTTRQMYLLDPQDQAIGHLGDSMTLTGTLEGNTVHVVSLKMHTSIGLEVPCVLGSRPVWRGANFGDIERTEGDSSPFFPLGRLVTVLQRAAGRAAKRKSTI
jgi:hypothetical protein